MSKVQTFTSEDEMPTLYIPYPQCSHCGNDVAIEDDHAWCASCLVKWGSICDDAMGEPTSTGTPCGIVEGSQREPYDYSGRHWEFGPRQPCILPSGHTSDHLCPYTITTTVLVSGNGE